MTEKLFEVYNKQTGEPVELDDLQYEAWVRRYLVYTDLEGFMLDEYGNLYLCDKCGNFVDCPSERFEVRFTKR